jgi:hypothetical protein
MTIILALKKAETENHQIATLLSPTCLTLDKFATEDKEFERQTPNALCCVCQGIISGTVGLTGVYT